MAKHLSRNHGRTVNAELHGQRNYIGTMKAKGFDFEMMVAEAFVRGIRDLGYTNTGTALDELIDNSIQAGATEIHVLFGFNDHSDKKPSSLAVIDNGHGMDPEMIRLSVPWGGTHRENDRTGFGRYGYGLPSASVSQGRRFTVFSIVDGGEPHGVTVDLDEIAEGKYTANGKVTVPEPVPSTLPDWINDHIREQTRLGAQGLKSGTIVLIEKLDRLTWTTAGSMERNLLEHFGVIYRNFLRKVNIAVQGKSVEPTDPLFLTPGCRFYDVDEDRAEALEPLIIDVKDDQRNVVGTIRTRFACFPPTFARVPADKMKTKGGKNNPRLNVMEEHNGIVVLRNGRQIDVVTQCRSWLKFNNDDRYWKVEVDFDATLDEFFGVTTSKQRIIISPRIWDNLKEAGVFKAIRNMRERYHREASQLKERQEQETPDKKRPSESAMEEAQKIIRGRPGGESVEASQKATERLQQEVNRKAAETRRPPAQVEQELLFEIQGRPFKVVTQNSPGAPFYRIDQVGGQKILSLNVAHRFYSDLYAGPESTPHLRAALEVLLFVIGDCELDATNERQLFYEVERAEWSNRLSITLDRLDQFIEGDGDKESPAEIAGIAQDAGAESDSVATATESVTG